MARGAAIAFFVPHCTHWTSARGSSLLTASGSPHSEQVIEILFIALILADRTARGGAACNSRLAALRPPFYDDAS